MAGRPGGSAACLQAAPGCGRAYSPSKKAWPHAVPARSHPREAPPQQPTHQPAHPARSHPAARPQPHPPHQRHTHPPLPTHPYPPVSPMDDRSLTIRWNSPAGSFTVASYSASGMPRCSLSMSISFRSNSLSRSWSAGRCGTRRGGAVWMVSWAGGGECGREAGVGQEGVRQGGRRGGGEAAQAGGV